MYSLPSNSSFLDDLLPRRAPLRYPPTPSVEPFPAQKKPISNSNVRDLQAAAHVSDGVAANVFNATPAAGRPSAVSSTHRPLLTILTDTWPRRMTKKGPGGSSCSA